MWIVEIYCRAAPRVAKDVAISIRKFYNILIFKNTIFVMKGF